ncbi:SGNH hydrolase [Decorospora gaudefroyi]|uniref:SGNH hydrolase n=1 Tax=Decorospora gaudefroyi TaxID=184978 RepID=A0A6A5K9A6_9PLEO|nr:SGNH hydrolase [Decorospora gaudefroyi]
MVSLKLFALISLAATASAQSADGPIRYMPFGDSITEIICWRSKLWQRLQSTEWANVNFVGSGRTENNCRDGTYDRDNEGHSGFLAIDIANRNQLDGNKQVRDIINAFTKLVNTMRTSNPKMKIIVAQIIPMGFGNFNGKIQELNRAIIPWAEGLNKTESPIWVVDQYTGFSGSGDLRDGVHPNNSGDEKMTKVWYPAIVHAFEVVKAERANSTAMTEREFVA